MCNLCQHQKFKTLMAMEMQNIFLYMEDLKISPHYVSRLLISDSKEKSIVGKSISKSNLSQNRKLEQSS